ncbi:indole-3-glycerol phosphate synthase TrpC [Merismopedia glauca]|uniref:Indole-3-glycerol phosphate synthase n=1 Tax=Merismopedia glauca CCAP 1448/3 TaxID=1296344 RepID=A0A2T1C4M2_9CYAN|nr:indole-3-glycerol phosphate synthase TrpC [Merismopedia glauca]PSB03174.1 indole-3-glycerol phosphate synthase TrpC [Merismopedia glauca CCAP 1448/3]
MQIRRRPPNPPVNVTTLRYQVPVEDAEPRHILEEIVWHKELEVEKMRERVSLLELQRQAKDTPSPKDFMAALRLGKTQPAVIAEVKKASPSKGVIREDFDPVAIAKSYQAGGATCLSVLTDSKFFQGSWENLALVRQAVDLPILCKEFVIYPYQIFLARTKGADAILLIAAILSDKDLKYYLKIIKTLKMTALVEVHTLEELERVLSLADIDLVGINNRNLETFAVDLQTTSQLLAAKGSELGERNILTVSESGLYEAKDVKLVADAGAKAILVGESLIRQANPGAGISAFFAEKNW